DARRHFGMGTGRAGAEDARGAQDLDDLGISARNIGGAGTPSRQQQHPQQALSQGRSGAALARNARRGLADTDGRRLCEDAANACHGALRIMTKEELSSWALANGWQEIGGE